MGGNAIVTNQSTQEQFFAEKIPLQTISRNSFCSEIIKFLTDFNTLFTSKTQLQLWTSEQIFTGKIFNGSTSYIMCSNYADSDIESVKPFVGDVDVVVPRELKKDLYDFLVSIEGTDISETVKYLGSNKLVFVPSMSQINCVFTINFKIPNVGELKVNCQVDFEFCEFINGEPSEFAKFGHSSNLKDAKAGIKAVHHKYLLRALIGTMYLDKTGIVICNGVRLDKPARVKIFDVNLGICEQFEIIDLTDGITTYKQLQRFQYKGTTDLTEIFRLCFNKEPTKDELDQLWSFVGLCELIEKYTPKELLPEVHQRYLNLLWESSPERTQELERNNPQLDLDVKLAGYEYFIKKFGFDDLHEPMLSDYYGTFGLHGKCNLIESFKAFVAKKNYVFEDF